MQNLKEGLNGRMLREIKEKSKETGFKCPKCGCKPLSWVEGSDSLYITTAQLRSKIGISSARQLFIARNAEMIGISPLRK